MIRMICYVCKVEFLLGSKVVCSGICWLGCNWVSYLVWKEFGVVIVRYGVAVVVF